MIDEKLKKDRIRDYEIVKVLIPYYFVEYELKTKRGKHKEDKTAINASFMDFPRNLGQVVPLFRPRLLMQEMKVSDPKIGEKMFPLSDQKLDVFFKRLLEWIRGVDEKVQELKASLRDVRKAYRFTLLLPIPSWLSRKEKVQSNRLSQYLGQKYAINLLFGLDFNDSIDEINLRGKKIFYSKNLLVISPKGFLIFEVWEGGIEPLTGIKRLLNEVPEALKRLPFLENLSLPSCKNSKNN